MNTLEFKNTWTNKGRVYVGLESGKCLDVTGGLVDPVAAADTMLAEERLKQIAEARAEQQAMAREFQREALYQNEESRAYVNR